MTNKITSARKALHDALLAAPLTRGDGQPLEPERRHALPQTGEYALPAAWVGLTSVVPVADGDLELEVPLVFAFDGEKSVQLALVDENAAVLWDAVCRIDTGAGSARPTSGTVQRLGPDGMKPFGFVINVRLPLTRNTLCDPGHLATT